MSSRLGEVGAVGLGAVRGLGGRAELVERVDAPDGVGERQRERRAQPSAPRRDGPERRGRRRRPPSGAPRHCRGGGEEPLARPPRRARRRARLRAAATSCSRAWRSRTVWPNASRAASAAPERSRSTGSRENRKRRMVRDGAGMARRQQSRQNRVRWPAAPGGCADASASSGAGSASPRRCWRKAFRAGCKRHRTVGVGVLARLEGADADERLDLAERRDEAARLAGGVLLLGRRHAGHDAADARGDVDGGEMPRIRERRA